MDRPLIILGTSRSRGETRRLIDEVFKDHLFELIDLNDFQVGYYSYNHAFQKDDFLSLAERMVGFEQIVFATPIYWYSMSAQLKAFFDRLTDLLEIRQDIGDKLKGKTVFSISSARHAPLPEGFEVPFKLTAQYLDMEYGGHLHGWWEEGHLQAPAREEISRFLKAVFPPNVDNPVDNGVDKL